MLDEPSHRIALNQFSKIILDAAIHIHKEMGPGLLESVYHHCMIHELSVRGLFVQTMIPTPLFYRGVDLKKTYVIDILVENEIVLELKAIEAVMPVHEAQIISYLKLANKRLGFLINFNVPLMRNGFHRFVNKF
jgi:GxxExxY protein